MKKQHLNNDLGDMWDTKGLTFLGFWALQKHQFGHGLLILHATAFGVKVGNILHIKWDIFKKEVNGGYVYFDYAPIEILAGNDEILIFDYHIIKQSEIVFNAIKKYNPHFPFDDFMYVNSTTGKVLNTSTLKRELQTLYKKTKDEIKELTGYDLIYRDIATNSFELAWAREMVNYYQFTKQVFLKVSKRMGHRTLKDTIALLELEIIEDVELKFDFYDKSNYVFYASRYDNEVDMKDLKTRLSSLKYALDGRSYNTKKSPFSDNI